MKEYVIGYSNTTKKVRRYADEYEALLEASIWCWITAESVNSAKEQFADKYEPVNNEE